MTARYGRKATRQAARHSREDCKQVCQMNLGAVALIRTTEVARITELRDINKIFSDKTKKMSTPASNIQDQSTLATEFWAHLTVASHQGRNLLPPLADQIGSTL